MYKTHILREPTPFLRRILIKNRDKFEVIYASFTAYYCLWVRVFNLNQCVRFKEDNLLFVIEHAANLRELNVSAVASVSNQLIRDLLKRKRLLTACDISFCPGVNESEVERYEQFLYSEFGSREFHLDKRFIGK